MIMLSIPRCSAVLLPIFVIINTAGAQYYYKDLVVTGQINTNYQALRNNKVSRVEVNPAAQGPADNSVTLLQTVYASQKLVITYSKVPDATESWLKSYYNTDGLLIKTVDSSTEFVNTAVYEYGAGDKITRISSNAVPVNNPAETEVHQWKYGSTGQPVQMIKIKNNTDSTFVDFTADEAGNVAEEKATRRNGNLGTYFYYYDDRHRLTDVARFNKRANRILPDYMFEYAETSLLSQLIVVPEGSADYQIWKYVYNQQGLKEKDLCYTKQKQLVAKVEYTYTFGK
jgi:hypothetical protein